MIGIYGGPKRLPATIKIMLYTVAGSLLMLAAIIYLGVAHHAQFGDWSFAAVKLAGASTQRHGCSTCICRLHAGLRHQNPALSRCTPGYPMPTPRPRQPQPSSSQRSWPRSASMRSSVLSSRPLKRSLPDMPCFCACSGVIGMIYCGFAAIGQKDIKRLLAFLVGLAYGHHRPRGLLHEHPGPDRHPLSDRRPRHQHRHTLSLCRHAGRADGQSRVSAISAVSAARRRSLPSFSPLPCWPRLDCQAPAVLSVSS